MSVKNHFSPGATIAIINLYKEGKSLREIAKRFSVGYMTIQRLLVKNKVELRKGGSGRN